MSSCLASRLCYPGIIISSSLLISFFFNDTAPTEIYTLSLHDALPIPGMDDDVHRTLFNPMNPERIYITTRSEEHTSELQSRQYLVCRLLLEKKKKANQRLSL